MGDKKLVFHKIEPLVQRPWSIRTQFEFQEFLEQLCEVASMIHATVELLVPIVFTKIAIFSEALSCHQTVDELHVARTFW